MSEVDEYLKQYSTEECDALERIRKLIKQIVPDAKEGISYGIPGFKYKGKYLIGYAAFKNHLSIFPGSEAIAAQGKKLDKYKTAKGTVQFTLDKPLSDSIIKEIVLFRVNDIETK